MQYNHFPLVGSSVVGGGWLERVLEVGAGGSGMLERGSRREGAQDLDCKVGFEVRQKQPVMQTTLLIHLQLH
jgi:hypothetical protein